MQGGNYAHRDDANIAMLAKMRMVMLEKWEGHCWQDCLAGGVGSPACQSSCGVENDILSTLGRIKAINPAVSGVLYLNTLLAFPFVRCAIASLVIVVSRTKLVCLTDVWLKLSMRSTR